MRELGAVTDERDTAALAAVVEGFDRNSINLIIREQPQKGRACRATTKAKWPIEPPPVVELTMNSPTNKDLLPAIINSPNYFCIAELRSLRNRPTPPDNLTGTTVSSLHKVKHNNMDLGVFVFSEIHVKTEGDYVLVFSLLEMRVHNGLSYASKVASVESHPFLVQHHSKPLGAVKESTAFLKSLANQGVKMRLRKNATNKKKERDDWTGNLQTATANPHMNWGGYQGLPSKAAYPPRGPAEDISTRIQQRPKVDPFPNNTTVDSSHDDSSYMLPLPPLSLPYTYQNSLPESMVLRGQQYQNTVVSPDSANLTPNQQLNWGYPPSSNPGIQRQSPGHYRQGSGPIIDPTQAPQVSFPPISQSDLIYNPVSQPGQCSWPQNNSLHAPVVERPGWAFQEDFGGGYPPSTSLPFTTFAVQHRNAGMIQPTTYE